MTGVLESCGENVEDAIEKLKQLQVTVEGSKSTMDQKHTSSVHDHWIEPFFNTLSQASNQEDAKSRLRSILAAFEEAAIENFKQNSEEMKTIKDEFLALRTNNSILAQAVVSQQGKLKQNKARNEELDQLKQRVKQYEERVKDLELANYSLNLHLRKAVDQNYEDHRPRDIY